VDAKRASETATTGKVFGQRQEPAKMFRVALYARVSTHDQQDLAIADLRHARICSKARLDR
jgi:predicted site-specific integrase-resolvase